MLKLIVGQSITLTIKGDGVAASWRVLPDKGVLALVPAADGRSCAVSVVKENIGMGRETIKAFNAAGQGIEYFAISIEYPSPEPTPTPAPPSPAPADVVEPEPAATG